MQCPHVPVVCTLYWENSTTRTRFPPEGGPVSTLLLLGTQTICTITGTSLTLPLEFYAEPLEASGPLNVSMTSCTDILICSPEQH